MKNTAIEKLSYTEVTKNISQAEYNQTQEEYILSKSPDKYMISLPVKVLMFKEQRTVPHLHIISIWRMMKISI